MISFGLISDDMPGICSQEDFDHDYRKLMKIRDRLEIVMNFMNQLSKDKGYTIPELESE